MKKVAATLILFLLHSSSALQELQFGSIGNDNETAAMPSRAQLFYLDTAKPATCTGNITSWRVCYYGPDNIESFGSYWATYAVYRRMGSGSNVRYVRVSEMFRAIRTVPGFTPATIVDGKIMQGGFNCYNDSIDIGDLPFTVETDNILGACIFDPENDPLVNRLPLDVIGEASGGSLLQMDTTGCSMEVIPSDIATTQLSTLSSRKLQIYANIECEPTTTQTTVAAATQTTTESENDHTTLSQTTTTNKQVPSTTETATKTERIQTTMEIVLTEESFTTTTTIHSTATLPFQMASPTKATTESAPIPESNAGGRTQAAGAVAGSVGGGLGLVLLLLLTVTSITACLILKRKGLNLSTNIEYSNSETRVGNHREANIVTNVNIAYKSVQQTVPINYAELEVMYSTAESLQSMESMEENVAYESSNAAIKQISLRSNVAYYKSERKLSEENDYDHIDDQYDYI